MPNAPAPLVPLPTYCLSYRCTACTVLPVPQAEGALRHALELCGVTLSEEVVGNARNAARDALLREVGRSLVDVLRKQVRAAPSVGICCGPMYDYMYVYIYV